MIYRLILTKAMVTTQSGDLPICSLLGRLLGSLFGSLLSSRWNLGIAQQFLEIFGEVEQAVEP